MPGYKGHLGGGLIAFGIMLTLLAARHVMLVDHIVPVMSLLLCTMAGALFPDIDTKSKGQKYFYWLIAVLMIYLIYKRLLVHLSVLAVAATTPMLVKHRGLFHNIWFLIAAFTAIGYSLMLYAPRYSEAVILHMLFFLAGVVSHLWLDMGVARMLKIR